MFKKIVASVGMLIFASTLAVAGQNASQPAAPAKSQVQGSASSTTQSTAKQTTKKKHRTHHKKQASTQNQQPKAPTAKQ